MNATLVFLGIPSPALGKAEPRSQVQPTTEVHGVLLSSVPTFVSPFIHILLFFGGGIGKASVVPIFQMSKPKDLVTLPNNAGSVTAFLQSRRHCCRRLHVLTNFITTTTLELHV